MIFNRFARSARSCVESAVEEARSLGHDSIDDEDLLLGVLESDDGNAAEALLSLGVTLEAAREQADRLFADALASVGISFDEIRRQAGEAFEMRSPASGRLPFSPSAKKALEQALRETIRLRDKDHRRARPSGDPAQRVRPGRATAGRNGHPSARSRGAPGSTTF